MGKKRIFAVGFDLPGDEFEYISFNSDQALLDADVILFQPTLGNYGSFESYNGKPLLSENSSFSTQEHLNHWRSEIVGAVNAGKLVVIYLAKPIECYRHTGQKEFSGTGRSRIRTNIVSEVSSYEAVPNLKSCVSKSGKEIRLEKDGAILGPYWKDFSVFSPYDVQIDGNFSKVLLRTRTGDKIVGALVHAKPGHLLFLPPLRYNEKKFIRYESKTDRSFWTKDALQFGKRLTAALVGLAETLKKSSHKTPPPNWVSDSKYRMAKEGEIQKEISSTATQISGLQTKKATLEVELIKAGGLRQLLYEQGRSLEDAILEALTLFGFKALPFADGESEFDAVFMSPEGRCLGEAEGKDNKPINVDKISQLERNLQEDFARGEVTTFAKGVLFGNAHRLLPMDNREEFFTEKCFSAAERAKIALVRTPDLFGPAKYLQEHPADVGYAKQRRDAILKSEGETVVFPSPPVDESSVLAEDHSAQTETRPNIALNPDPHKTPTD
jgi:hypothetical protein